MCMYMYVCILAITIIWYLSIQSSSVPLHKVVGSHITPLSTEYQVQYTWKSGPQTDTPLLSAEKLINGERSQKEEGRSEGGGPEGLINGWRSQGQEGKGGTEELINREKSQGQEGDGGAERLSPRKRKGKHKLMNMEFTKEKGRKEKGKTRTRDRTNVEGGKVKDDGVKTTETTVKHPSKTVSLTNGQLPPSSPPPNDKTRHRSKQKGVCMCVCVPVCARVCNMYIYTHVLYNMYTQTHN